MIIELVSFLGTSVGGKVFGMIHDAMSEKRHREREELEFRHKENMAARGNLREYYGELNQENSHGGYSPLTWVISFTILLFGVTYCAAALTCFFDDPTKPILTKDPGSDPSTFALFFGLIEWDIANNKVISMSKAGLGFLMLHPIVFILSMVTTGDRPRKK